MEKTKSKKAKTIDKIKPTIDRMVSKYFSQITYPAPYSQSWVADQPPALVKNNMGRKANIFNCPKRPTESQRLSQSYSTVRGPDPTAPHLKYGVFPNRRVSSSRALPKAPPVKPVNSLHPHNVHPRLGPPDLASNKSFSNYSRKKPLKKAAKKESPVFIFRTIDRRFTRQLSQSETMHLDIKPKRKTFLAPSFCPSPHFKIMSPKMSPSCRSPR